MTHRRRGIVAALTLVPAMIIALAAAQPSSAEPLAGAAVISGDARFEVLSSTVIRTEYAGDAHFVDAPTFNAIGRNGFARTAFTAETVAGWLSIETDAMTLRYKVGSGPFGADNLQVRLRAGRQDVTSYPWAAKTVPACAIGVLCEAEDLNLNGVSVATDHNGYTGRGFAAGFQNTGNSLSFQVNVATAATYEFQARYANSLGGDGQNTTRTLTVSADGGTTRCSHSPWQRNVRTSSRPRIS